MTRRPRDQSVGPWAKEKLASLGAYLDYYTKRLKNQAWCEGTWFIDAFAGPGQSPVRRLAPPPRPLSQTLQRSLFDEPSQPEPAPTPERVEYVKGSPRVALELANPFSHYVFIEKAPDRLRDLRSLRDAFPQRDIEVLAGDANAQLQQLLARRIDWRSNKGVVFLDPFGMHVPWATISDIAQTKGLEVIINFPFGMAINRLLARSARITPSRQNRLDSTFGGTDWRGLVYVDRNTLFGPQAEKRSDAAKRVLDWFSGRLRVAFGYASSAQLIRNSRGNPLYYLIWAGPHQAGLTGAEYILGQQRTRAERGEPAAGRAGGSPKSPRR